MEIGGPRDLVQVQGCGAKRLSSRVQESDDLLPLLARRVDFALHAYRREVPNGFVVRSDGFRKLIDSTIFLAQQREHAAETSINVTAAALVQTTRGILVHGRTVGSGGFLEPDAFTGPARQ